LQATYRFGYTLDLNEAHAAISSHGKPLVVTEARNLDTSCLARLIDCVSTVDLGKEKAR